MGMGITTCIVMSLICLWLAFLAHKRVVRLQTRDNFHFLKEKCETAIKEAQACTTLSGLLDVHKKAWTNGIHNANLAPCSCGMFRTQDIATMSPNEVYIGGIWGLNTKNITEWEKYGYDEPYGANGFGIDPEIKLLGGLLVPRYKNLLVSNFNSIRSACISELEKL